jgi:hypothetical protein
MIVQDYIQKNTMCGENYGDRHRSWTVSTWGGHYNQKKDWVPDLVPILFDL